MAHFTDAFSLFSPSDWVGSRRKWSPKTNRILSLLFVFFLPLVLSLSLSVCVCVCVWHDCNLDAVRLNIPLRLLHEMQKILKQDEEAEAQDSNSQSTT